MKRWQAALIVAALVCGPVAEAGTVIQIPKDKALGAYKLRFEVLAGVYQGAVLDNETGLIWEQAPANDLFTWTEASIHCNRRIIGFRMGWRLPTVQDLTSLVDPVADHPALPSNHPFANMESGPRGLGPRFWSATHKFVPDDPSFKWTVDFAEAVGVGFAHDESGSSRAWCVRGGSSVDLQ